MTAQTQESLTLQKKYDLGSSRYSEGLDFYNHFLWHTTSQKLYQFNLDSAIDTDGDGDYDLQAERTWILTHSNYSASSVWFDDELFNFTFTDTLDNPSDDIFRLNLNDDETYQWQHVGDGLGLTNWGSCRDSRNPGESIIYTGHHENLLMWFDPENGEIVGTFFGPDGLNVIDGIAIHSFGDHDVMYVTGKNTPFIWEYLVPGLATGGIFDDLETVAFDLHPNFPNPFNPQTTISFKTDLHQRIRVVVFDIRGRWITELCDQLYQAGEHSVEWRGRDDAGRNVPSGEYFFRIEFGSQVVTQKAVLLR